LNCCAFEEGPRLADGTYVFGLLAHAISDALFEALEVLVEIPLVFE
jgi:hypothetical protein